MKSSIRFSCFGFSNLNKKEGSEEIMSVLKKVSFENGKNLVDQNYVVDLQIKDDGSVNILLKLDQNYRKIKALCHTELASVPWIKNLSINMAPKVGFLISQKNNRETFHRNKRSNSLREEACKELKRSSLSHHVRGESENRLWQSIWPFLFSKYIFFFMSCFFLDVVFF